MELPGHLHEGLPHYCRSSRVSAERFIHSVETGVGMQYNIAMEKGEKVETGCAAPENMVTCPVPAAYQRLHLCDYLRDLPENPVQEAENAGK